MSKGINKDGSGKSDFLSSLKNSSNVASQSKKVGVVGICVGVVVLMIFLMFVFSGSDKHEKHQTKARSSSESYSIQENAKKLEELEREARKTIVLTRNVTQTNSKALKQRRNAPTEMFSGTIGVGEQGARNKTLVAQSQFSSFANSQSSSEATIGASRVDHPEYTVVEGEFIHATLETAINSDMPGMVRAVISEPVYAYEGAKPLIPAGSRLVGQYSSSASNGLASTRVFVMWNRIITPDGISMIINSPGSDNLGRAGSGANSVNRHFIAMFGTAALLSVIGATTAMVGVNSGDQPNSANAYRQSIAGAFQQSAQNALDGNANIKPTIHVYQGSAINVFVARDIDLYKTLAG